MIPYPYNMVDMGGIDLAEANGTVVDGLYAKIVEAVDACGDVVLYNWKFAGIEIAPQHTSILIGDPITINGAVQVTEQDEVIVPGINPDPPPPTVIIPLNANENGEYLADDYEADGFNPVNVAIPPPVLSTLHAFTNGSYYPQPGESGFDEVIVSVHGQSSVIVVGNFYLSGSSEYSTQYRVQNVLGDNASKWWGGSSGQDQSLTFEFTEPTSIAKIKFASAFQLGSSHWWTGSIEILVSDNGTSYESVTTLSDLPDDNVQREYSISTGLHKYYRLLCKRPSGTTWYPGLGQLQMYI